MGEIAAPGESTRRVVPLTDDVLGKVLRGYADVFYVRTGEDGAYGRRRHLRRLQAGDAFFGQSYGRGDGALVLVKGQNTTISLARGSRSLRSFLSPDAAVAAVEAWVKMVLESLHRGRPPQEYVTAAESAHVTITKGSALMSDGRMYWIARRSGVCAVLGRRSRRAEVHPEGFGIVTRHAWLVAREEGLVTCKSSRTLLEEGLLETALRSVMLQLIALLHEDEVERDQADLRLIATREQTDAQSMHRACRELGSVLDSAEERGEEPDPLEAALRAAAEGAGIEVKPQPFQHQRRVRDRLTALARTSGFSIRRVVLRGDWWAKDAGSMVGATLPADGGTALPVALLWRRGHYVSYDPSTGREWRIDDESARSLSPFAYVLYRPLRERHVRLFAFLRFGLKGSGRDLVAVVALGMVAGALSALTPILTAVIFDHAIPEADRSQVGQIATLLLTVALLAGILQFVRGVAVLRIETRLDTHAQSAVWDRLLSLPASFFRGFTAGDLAVRTGGVTVIRQMVSSSFTSLLLTGIFACWYLALLFYYYPAVAWWVMVALFVSTLLSLMLATLQLRHLRRATEVQMRLSGTVLQLITGISKVRVAGAEIRAYVQWARRFAEQRRLYVAGRRHANALLTLQSVLPVLLMILVYGIASMRGDPDVSTGEFLAFHAALLALTGATALITHAFTAAVSAAPFYEQLRPILEAEPENDLAKPSPGELEGDIEIRHVTFRYGTTGPPVLDDVSLRVRPGEYVAVVGPSGSGKSSLLRLLLGFERPDSGSIYFDGQEAASMNSQELRRQIGVVLQDGGMLTGDVFSNIVGSSGASMDEAWEAARMAGLEEDLKRMPMGMHTIINEGGTTISGGQRQRLKVARAIVSKPRILLFDEATSALDNVTQSIVTKSLASLKATRIVIAHRLSTIVHADRIIVLDAGRIVQEGTYHSLLDQPGLFRDLAMRQII